LYMFVQFSYGAGRDEVIARVKKMARLQRTPHSTASPVK